MTLPNLKQEELISLLRDNGWVEVSNTDWETHQRIMIGNGKESFPLQLIPVYYFPLVVKLCESLGINPPADCKLCYDQYEELKNRRKEKESSSDDEDQPK